MSSARDCASTAGLYVSDQQLVTHPIRLYSSEKGPQRPLVISAKELGQLGRFGACVGKEAFRLGGSALALLDA